MEAATGEAALGAAGYLGQRLQFWLERWLREDAAKDSFPTSDVVSVGPPLPRPTLEQLDGVCATYKEFTGLGIDCFNPRWILLLPLAWKERFIDMLMRWEEVAEKPAEWLHLFVLRPKPEGGDRTIGLSVGPLR
eukprot:3481868-Karenia_brevis.AAC.1